MNSDKTRVYFFVNKRTALISITVTYHSTDLNILSLRLIDERIVHIHNLYNFCKRSGEDSVLSLLYRVLNENKEEEHIVLGDFNLHHLKWGGDHVIADADAYELVVKMKTYRLKRTLPKGIITWRKNASESIIDLVFVTQLLRDSVIESVVAEDMNSHSDHLPIRTILGLRTISAQSRMKRNWKKTNHSLLQQTLQKSISYETDLTSNDEYDNFKDGIDRQAQSLIRAIRKVIEAFTS